MNSFLYSLRRNMQVVAFNLFGPETMSKVYFRIVLKQKLNLEHPNTFNAKIQWYKLNYCPYNEDIILCSDKLRIREYLERKQLSKFAIPLIGFWDNAEEINWESLPKQFVLKANHGCAYNIICTNKDVFDKKKATKLLNRWIKEDFGKFNAEVHYSKIKPKIICEMFLQDKNSTCLIDYKIHCFNGKPKFVLICSDREGNKADFDYYDLNWKKLNYSTTYEKSFEIPSAFDEMIHVAEKIAADFPFVRVDFYNTADGPLIGELTFVPAGGLDETLLKEADIEIGKLLYLK